MLVENTTQTINISSSLTPPLEALRKGDTKAYNDLYQQCRPIILHYVRNNHGQKEDAIDLLQEAMLVLFRNLQREDFTLKCKATSYIYVVCRQNWLYHLRKQKLASVDITSLVDILPEETKLVESLTDEQLDSVLNKLDQVSKQLLVLFYYHNQSLEQIAKQLNISNANAAKVRKFRCIDKLRELAKCIQAVI